MRVSAVRGRGLAVKLWWVSWKESPNKRDKTQSMRQEASEKRYGTDLGGITYVGEWFLLFPPEAAYDVPLHSVEGGLGPPFESVRSFNLGEPRIVQDAHSGVLNVVTSAHTDVVRIELFKGIYIRSQ